ncbi:MAG: heavy metal translocating P-type ATPase metal-binding domain-containing protein, partial [Planctomycetota bacterium]
MTVVMRPMPMVAIEGAACLCTHCSQPVPAGLVEVDAKEQFCCGGCRTVYGILRGSGLGTYYRVREATGIEIDFNSLG